MLVLGNLVTSCLEHLSSVLLSSVLLSSVLLSSVHPKYPIYILGRNRLQTVLTSQLQHSLHPPKSLTHKLRWRRHIVYQNFMTGCTTLGPVGPVDARGGGGVRGRRGRRVGGRGWVRPICWFHLRGECTRVNCPFSHSNPPHRDRYPHHYTITHNYY